MILPILLAAVGIGALFLERKAKAQAPAWTLLPAAVGWAKAGEKGPLPPMPSPIPNGFEVAIVLQNTTTGELVTLACGVVGQNAGKLTLQIGMAIGKNGPLSTSPAGYAAGSFLDVAPSFVIFTH